MTPLKKKYKSVNAMIKDLTTKKFYKSFVKYQAMKKPKKVHKKVHRHIHNRCYHGGIGQWRACGKRGRFCACGHRKGRK